MSFEAKEYTVDKLLNDAIYYIPRNQRRYVWTSENWTDIYDDILLVADGVAPSHFIGSIVLKDEGKEDGLSKFTVIDGQQRILTLTILLTAIMFVMKKRDLMDDFGGTQKYLVAKDIKNKNREIVYPEHHLTLPKMVNAVIEMEQSDLQKKSINAFSYYCTVSTSKDKSIIGAFSFFAEKLIELETEKLLSIRDAIINIGYVNIISSTEEDSYTIFEILNARGLALEDHELLKNYIMRYLQPIERRDDAKRIWEEIELNLGNNIKAFLRHYAIQKYNYSSDKKRGISVYKTIQNATKGRQVNLLLEDIKMKAIYYARILNPDADDKIENEVFTFFRRYRVEQFRPLLLSIMHQYMDENISQETYHSLLEFLYTFCICYKIIGEENSNKLSDTVRRCAYRIENDFSESVIDECLAALKSRLPTFTSFENSFKNVGYSNHWAAYEDSKGKERCKLILELIEKYISGRDINMEVTIEHILPDCENIENAQIGNLFLLEGHLNKRCAAKTLSEKCDIYNESVLMCPRGVAQRYKDKEFYPSDRTNFLAKLIYNNILGIKAES